MTDRSDTFLRKQDDSVNASSRTPPDRGTVRAFTSDSDRRQTGGSGGVRQLRGVAPLWVTALVLVVASAGSYAAAVATETTAVGSVMDELAQNLSVGVDIALPTWFASALWALLGAFALLHGRCEVRGRWRWHLLVGVSMFASVDEFLMLHERLSRPASGIQHVLGWDLGAARWTLLGVLAAALVAALLWPLLRSLSARSRLLLLAAGAAFLLGSLGLELLGGWIAQHPEVPSGVPITVMHLEESLEFAGVILAIQALLEGISFRVAARFSREEGAPIRDAPIERANT